MQHADGQRQRAFAAVGHQALLMISILAAKDDFERSQLSMRRTGVTAYLPLRVAFGTQERAQNRLIADTTVAIST